MVAVIVIKVSG